MCSRSKLLHNSILLQAHVSGDSDRRTDHLDRNKGPIDLRKVGVGYGGVLVG